jgi:hypothetical protein
MTLRISTPSCPLARCQAAPNPRAVRSSFLATTGRSCLYYHPPTQLGHVLLENGWTSPVVHELPIAPRFDQTSASQLLQVVRDRRLPHREAPAEMLAADLGLLRDMLEDFEPPRIGKRFSNTLELLGIH